MKVGDYVRTENGIIDKISNYRYEPEYENGHVIWFEKSDSGCRFTDKDLLKASPNIIDLIEVGDYVNGVIVSQSYIDNIKHIAPEIKENNYGIKSIVTKEQFESMEYKVCGDEE